MIVQESPEWLLKTIGIVCLVLFFGLLGGSLFLEIQYIGPFTLINTSEREKWRRATILASLQTAIIPILCVAAIILSPYRDLGQYILICSGLWMVVLPITILFKRCKLDWQLMIYKALSKSIKNGNKFYYRWYRMRWYMTAEQRQFLREGFPDGLVKKDYDVSSRKE